MFEHIAARQYIEGNRQLLRRSKRCGCIWCLEVYDPEEIWQWHGDDIEGVEPSAFCAYCNSDRVLPDAAGYPLTPEFLTRMHNYWMEAVREYTAKELVEEDTIDYTNEHYLAKKGFRIEIGEELEPYTDYFIYEGSERIFRTIYPRELLIKVAQLLPNSDVRIAAEEFTVGGEPMSHETLRIEIHYD